MNGNKKTYLLKNEKIVAKSVQCKIEYFSGERGPLRNVRVNINGLFKDMKVGEEKEIAVTLIYKFDDGPLKTQTIDYTIGRYEPRLEVPWFLQVSTP
jgi:hypothetical protein